MRVATFPYMGDYNVVFKSMGESLGFKVLLPNPITKETVALGAKHSPDCVCVPFKYNMGNFIESLEHGAEVLFQAGGGCRFNLYGEAQEKILEDLGYKFEMINIFRGFAHMIRDLKYVSPNLTIKRACYLIALNYMKLTLLDSINHLIRDKISYEDIPGSSDRIKREFLNELAQINTISEVRKLKRKTLAKIYNIKTTIPEPNVRVGIVGEYYIAAEPSSNYYIENKLIEMGIKVTNHVTLSGVINDAFFYVPRKRRFAKKGSPYINYHIGAHGTESVVHTLRFIEQGYDAIVHLKPFGCMPEVNAMSALYKISKDKNVPIVYFSYDEQTSETGICTRLEALRDMLFMKAGR